MQTCGSTRRPTVYGFSDIIPTRHHVPPPWIMAYDLYPTETLTSKNDVLPQAVKENWICHFYHDFEMPLCTFKKRTARLRSTTGKLSVSLISG